ncbi:hypothetical protein AD929_12800 [Gluconobacter potus]|uniref:Uncharacterized protein n=1 Tax=Gluconobacter potus TaxID=2724927 RepID=A0A149QRZ8_9PROT|nr:hypothetical protein AD929_12800 [Gluconobacter potus]
MAFRQSFTATVLFKGCIYGPGDTFLTCHAFPVNEVRERSVVFRSKIGCHLLFVQPGWNGWRLHNSGLLGAGQAWVSLTVMVIMI